MTYSIAFGHWLAAVPLPVFATTTGLTYSCFVRTGVWLDVPSDLAVRVGPLSTRYRINDWPYFDFFTSARSVTEGRRERLVKR